MRRLTLLCLPVLSLACTESVESTDVRTSGVYPEFSVVADGSGSSQVSARLKVGGNDSNTFLDLKDDDHLEVTVGADTRRLEETSSHRYSATFPTDAEGMEFVFAFRRGEDDDSAPRSVVTLPAPFHLEMAATEASRAAGNIGFSWDPPANGQLAWDVEGDCVWTEDGTTPDDGEASLGAEQVHALSSRQDQSCTVQLTVRRSRSGSVDGAFSEGGETSAAQARAQSFTSTP